MDMTEEEASQLRQEHAELKEALAQKDQRVEEVEGLLMSALRRIEELERRLGNGSHRRRTVGGAGIAHNAGSLLSPV